MDVRDDQSPDLDAVASVTAVDGEVVEPLVEAHRRLATRLRVVVPGGRPVHQALLREGVAHVLSLRASRAEAPAAAGLR